MSVTLDPTSPADSSSPTLGASDIRTLTGEVQQMFGGAGSASVTYAIPPFHVDTTTGLVTVVGPPTAALGIATMAYVQSTAAGFTGVATGTNTLAATLSPVPATVAAMAGLPVYLRCPNANTGAVTFNPNALGPVAVVKNGNVALTGGEIIANAWLILVYDTTNTNFQIIGYLPPAFLEQVRAYKATDQTVTSSTSLVNDTALSFAIAASEAWQFELDLYSTFDGGAASGIKAAFTVPSGATLQWLPTAVSIPITTSGSSQILAAGGGATTTWMGKLIGQVINSTNAGTVQLQWAQNTSDATATALKAGSSLLATRLIP
jgi:hypothetical protein